MGRKKVPDDHPLKAVKRRYVFENGQHVLRHMPWQSFVAGPYKYRSISNIMKEDPGYVMDLVDKGMVDLEPRHLTELQLYLDQAMTTLCRTSDIDSYITETE